MDKISIVFTGVPSENCNRVSFAMLLTTSRPSLKRPLLYISCLGCNFCFFICIRFDLAWRDSDYKTPSHQAIFIDFFYKTQDSLQCLNQTQHKFSFFQEKGLRFFSTHTVGSSSWKSG